MQIFRHASRYSGLKWFLSYKAGAHARCRISDNLCILIAPDMLDVKRPVIVYIESTPNPSSMKFVVNKFLLQEGSVEYTSPEQTENSPLAKQLFDFSGVTGVFVTSTFVTVTKAAEADWAELSPILREFIKGYMDSGDPVFTGPRIQVADPTIERTTTNSDLETKIIEAL